MTTALAHRASAATAYVDQNSPDPTPPYSTQATAAHEIQDAVDVTTDGDTVLVEPGTYNLTNQVTITDGIHLLSASNADQTIINGQSNAWCLWVSNSTAVVDGFTIENGSTGQLPPGGVFLVGGTVQNCILPNYYTEGDGIAATINGGTLSNSIVHYIRQGFPPTNSAVYCTNGAMVIDCQIIGASGSFEGMGIHLVGSELKNTLIQGASGADFAVGVALYAVSSTIIGCTVAGNVNGVNQQGGGVYLNSCLMDRCIITGNRSYVGGGTGFGGGGIFETNSVIRDSLIASNVVVTEPETTSEGFGGGVYMQGGALVNCTVTGNTAYGATNPAEGSGVYVENGGITNSIIYFNYNAFPASEGEWFNAGPGVFDHCCTTPDPGGTGNITQDPQFVDPTNGDFHLKSTSPCIDAGIVQPWMTGAQDLDGKPRTVNGTVDIGAYEHPATPPQSVELQKPQWQNGSFSFSFPTQANDAYYVQYTDSLAPAVWQTFTSFVGDGTTATVTNQAPVNPNSFYRVVAE